MTDSRNQNVIDVFLLLQHGHGSRSHHFCLLYLFYYIHLATLHICLSCDVSIKAHQIFMQRSNVRICLRTETVIGSRSSLPPWHTNTEQTVKWDRSASVLRHRWRQAKYFSANVTNNSKPTYATHTYHHAAGNQAYRINNWHTDLLLFWKFILGWV